LYWPLYVPARFTGAPGRLRVRKQGEESTGGHGGHSVSFTRHRNITRAAAACTARSPCTLFKVASSPPLLLLLFLLLLPCQPGSGDGRPAETYPMMPCTEAAPPSESLLWVALPTRTAM